MVFSSVFTLSADLVTANGGYEINLSVSPGVFGLDILSATGLDGLLATEPMFDGIVATTLGLFIAPGVLGIAPALLSSCFGFDTGFGDASAVKSNAVEISVLVCAVFLEAIAAKLQSTACRSRFLSLISLLAS